jgi:putative spermidine/putrescine transport system permease protein
MLGLRNSVTLGLLSVVFCLILGYPLAWLIARTERPRVFLVLTILVLAAMQLDMTVRLYGITTIFGNNNGLINQALEALGFAKVPFLYNMFGVTLGTVQFALPFMIFTLIGVLRNIDPSYEQAARSLGATEWVAFRDVVLPLSMPGIVAGSVIVFAIGVSGYIVPTLLGSARIPTLATHLYQQINDMGFWQFGAAIGFILFAVSLTAITVVYRISARQVAGGRA